MGKILRITKSVCALCMTTELNVIAIRAEEGEVITDNEVHKFNCNNLTQLMRTGWYQCNLADGCTITYNLI
jgi:hypothetical protein